MKICRAFFIFVLCFISLIPKIVLAQNCGDSSSCTDSDLTKKYNCISDLTAQCQTLLNEEQQKDKTLQTQLNFIDSKTKFTKLKIDETNTQIAKLEKEISELSVRITDLSSSLNSISQVLLNRIVQTYKQGSHSVIDFFFSSNGFADFFNRSKYISVAQANDKKVLYQLQATKATYNDQKIDKESRQKQAEELKADLVNYQNQLDSQQKAKSQLLTITKNNEKVYQSLLIQLKAEQDSIAQAISNVGPTVGPVTKGQSVALMGSTGCSTGPHLHFEVFENAKVEGGRIIGTRVNPHKYLDTGKLGPPLLGFPTETDITTEYGDTYEVLGYHSDHWGLDIVPKDGIFFGRPIYAADNGIAYKTSATCDCFMKATCSPEMMSGGSPTGKGLIIDHQNGIVTLYWHIL